MLKQASAQAQRLRASQAKVAKLQRALMLSEAEVQQTRGSVDAVGPPCGTCQQPLVAHCRHWQDTIGLQWRLQ